MWTLIKSWSSTPSPKRGRWWAGWTRPDLTMLCQSSTLNLDFVFKTDSMNITEKTKILLKNWRLIISILQHKAYKIRLLGSNSRTARHSESYDIAGLSVNSNIPRNNTQSLAIFIMLILAMSAIERDTYTEIW